MFKKSRRFFYYKVSRLTWMTHSTAQVDESSFSQQDNVLAVLQGESVDLKRKDKIYVMPNS